MLAKMTSKNQVTIPKAIIDQMPPADYFEVEYKDGAVILKPLISYNTNLEQIRSKVKKLNIKENCVAEAVKWARKK